MRSAAEAYGVLRCLSLQQGIISRELAEARQALLRHGLGEIEQPSPEHDQLLLLHCRQDDDPGAFLCLRCRVSWPLEQKVRSLHRKYQQNYGVELLELAAFALDDTGRLLPYQQKSGARPRTPEPFGVQVIRSYQPELSSLGHWAQQKLVGNPALKTYLRHQGVLLIRDWALLGDIQSPPGGGGGDGAERHDPAADGRSAASPLRAALQAGQVDPSTEDWPAAGLGAG